jgi:hypothetical protein
MHRGSAEIRSVVMKSMSFLFIGTAVAALVVFGPASLAQPNPDEIFLEEDTDSFDAGLPVGAQFPEIRAIYEGREINDISQFFGDRGLAFFAVRSVDW